MTATRSRFVGIHEACLLVRPKQGLTSQSLTRSILQHIHGPSHRSSRMHVQRARSARRRRSPRWSGVQSRTCKVQQQSKAKLANQRCPQSPQASACGARRPPTSRRQSQRSSATQSEAHKGDQIQTKGSATTKEAKGSTIVRNGRHTKVRLLCLFMLVPASSRPFRPRRNKLGNMSESKTEAQTQVSQYIYVCVCPQAGVTDKQTNKKNNTKRNKHAHK